MLTHNKLIECLEKKNNDLNSTKLNTTQRKRKTRTQQPKNK